MLRISAVAVVALATAPQLVAWTPPERVDRRPENYVIYSCAIAAGPGSSPHIVWSECPRGTYLEKIMYARRQGDTWTVPVNVSRDSGDLRQPALVVDVLGRPLVLWSEEGRQRIRYVRFAGDSWTAPKQAFAARGITPRMVIDSRNYPHVVFEEYTGRGGIWYSRYDASADSWATPVPVATDSEPLGWSGLAVDRRDHLHAVWMSWGTNDIGYSTYDGTSWAAPVSLPNPAPGTLASYPRVAADTNCLPHVVWDESRVYYSYLSGDSWTAPHRVDEQPSGYSVVTADYSNRIHVVWARDNGLMYSAKSDTGWSLPESLGGRRASLAEVCIVGSSLACAWREDWKLYFSENRLNPAVDEQTPHEPLGGTVRLVGSPAGRTVLLCLLKAPSEIAVSLYDVAGRCVWRAPTRIQAAGLLEVNLSPACLADSGLYFATVRIGKRTETLKLVLVK